MHALQSDMAMFGMISVTCEELLSTEGIGMVKWGTLIAALMTRRAAEVR